MNHGVMSQSYCDLSRKIRNQLYAGEVVGRACFILRKETVGSSMTQRLVEMYTLELRNKLVFCQVKTKVQK